MTWLQPFTISGDDIKKMIVVLGMHRSGTSAITRGLQILGANLGDTLLPPAFDNPKGFWEDQDILRINEAILAEFQSAYDRVGLLEIDMIHPSPAIAELAKDAQSALAQKFARVDVFAIKDPRLARLLPFWQRAFSDAGLAVAYIIALRNPLSVADSLALRNRFDLVKSSQLWHEHMLTAIHYTQGQQRVVVDYDQMLTDPETAFRRITKQLHIGAILPEELKEYQENFLDRSLRHTYYTRKDVLEAPYLPQGVRDIYPILADCAEDLRDSDDPELFMMVTQQMKFQRGISPVLNLLGRLDHRVTYQDQLLNEQDRERAEVEANLDNLRKSHAETIEEVQRLQQRHIEQDRERAEVEANLDNLRKSHAETIEEVQRLRAQATESQALRNSRLWRLRDTIRLEPWSIGKTVRIARLSLSLATPAPLRRRISAILRKNSTAVTLQPTPAAAAVDADFDAEFYVQMYPDVAAAGVDPYAHYLDHGKSEGRFGKPPITTGMETITHQPTPAAATVGEIIAQRFPPVHPLSFYLVPRSVPPRLSIVTDSVGPSSLFGGVGTSLILAALLANRLGATLRIVTRTEPADAAPIADVFANSGIALDTGLELAMSPVDGSKDLDVVPDELFLSTSWWTTRATLGAVDPNRIIALVQEDERMFYPQGDERLLCAETLNHPDILTVVNTEGLFRHLTQGPAALKNLARKGMYFEPAFPVVHHTLQRQASSSEKRRLFFYARPQHLRNLFFRGIEAIDEAAAQGLFPADRWELYWVGKDLPYVRLAGGIVPVYRTPMGWGEYKVFISTMDAGFVLMDTPHPSYPPLDLAAIGAAVLTNTHPGKEDLSHYSHNILTAEPSRDALVDGLRRLVILSEDDAARARNRAADHIQRDWEAALRPVVDRLATHFTD